MNTQRQHFFVILVLLGCFMAIAPSEAAITVQTFNSPVEVLLKGESVWEPLSEAIQLDAGDQILTGKGASAELVFEDGSTLHLDEGTQLAISELEFSTTEKTRVSRLKLFWGAITAKATTLAFKKNVFEVETETVVAGFKFSSMTIISGDNGTQIIPIDGTLEFQQISGNTQIVHTSEDGVTTTYTLPPNAQVSMEITPDEPVQITSNVAIPNVRVTTTDDQGNQATATLTIPQNATVGIDTSETEGQLFTLSSNIDIPDVSVETTASDGSQVSATLRIPGNTTTGDPGQVNIGVTDAGQLSLSGNTDIPDVTLQSTSDEGTADVTLTVPAGGEVNIGQDPTTGETTIGSNVEVEVTIGEKIVIVGADSEIGITATPTGAEVNVNEGTAVIDQQTFNEGDTTPVEAPETPAEGEPAPATATEEEPVAPSAPEQPSGGTSGQPSEATPTPTPEATPERPPDEDTGSPTLPE